MESNKQSQKSTKSPNSILATSIKIKKFNDVVEKVKKIFNDNNEEFGDNGEQLLTEERPEEPDFPIIVFVAAVIKDIIDVPTELTFIGMIFTTFLSLILSVGLFVWSLDKLHGGWWKRGLVKQIWTSKFWKRYVLTVVLELVPFFKIIPANIIFILLCHYHEKKIVRLINLALDELKGAGFLKYIK